MDGLVADLFEELGDLHRGGGLVADRAQPLGHRVDPVLVLLGHRAMARPKNSPWWRGIGATARIGTPSRRSPATIGLVESPSSRTMRAPSVSRARRRCRNASAGSSNAYDEPRGRGRPPRPAGDPQRLVVVVVPEEHRGRGNVEDLDHGAGHDAGDAARAGRLGEGAGELQQRLRGRAPARAWSSAVAASSAAAALRVGGEQALLEGEERLLVVERGRPSVPLAARRDLDDDRPSLTPNGPSRTCAATQLRSAASMPSAWTRSVTSTVSYSARR